MFRTNSNYFKTHDRYGFNGMSKDDELKGEGNSYDFGARMLDTRLGRWLTIDPLAGKYPSISPYAFVANSPLLFLDPDGEKIVFSKNLSRAEKKEYKAHLKNLRQGSPTFNKMYRELKKSKDIYTYDITDECNGDYYDPEKKTVYVNLNGNDLGISVDLVIAHETAHEWRDKNGLDIKKSETPFIPNSVEDFVFAKKSEFSTEFEATHIENVIRAEMGVELREEYGEKSDFNARNKIKIMDKEYADFSKTQPVMVGKDSNYNYQNKEQDHFEIMKDRKHTSSEINVHQYEDPKKYH